MKKIFDMICRKIQKQVADTTIRTKILIGFVLLSVFGVLFVGGFSYRSSSNIILSQDEAYTRSILNQIVDRTEKLKDEVFKISIPLMTNSVITADYSNLDDPSLMIERKRAVQNQLTSVLFIKSDICSIYVCTQNGVIISSGPLSSHDESNYLNYQVYNAAIENDMETYWIGIHENEFFLDNHRNVITFTRPLYNSNDLKTFGALIINIPDTVIDRICTNEIASNILIVDLKGNTIFNTSLDSSFPLQTTDLQTKILDNNESDGKFNIEYGKSTYSIQFIKPMEDDWIFIAVTPYDYLEQNSMTVRNSIIGILIITIIISLVLSYIISSFIVVPIQKIIKLMKRVQGGELEIGPIFKNKSETGQLAENFEIMINKINLLMKNVNDENQKKREAELNTLQAQITPHFVYNTLNSIKCLAIIQKEKGIEEMTSNLIELFQLSISSNEVFISVKYEIEMLKKYIFIQNFMNGSKYKVEFELEDEIFEYLTLKMTLQPFVENSILHSNIQKSQNGIIIIRAYKDGETIHFEIEDNGIGMSAEQIEKVIFGENQSNRKYSGIGIKNVDERIKMHFGNDFGVSFQSMPGKYTIASIIIPAFMERDKDKYDKSNNC